MQGWKKSKLYASIASNISDKFSLLKSRCFEAKVNWSCMFVFQLTCKFLTFKETIGIGTVSQGERKYIFYTLVEKIHIFTFLVKHKFCCMFVKNILGLYIIWYRRNALKIFISYVLKEYDFYNAFLGYPFSGVRWGVLPTRKYLKTTAGPGTITPDELGPGGWVVTEILCFRQTDGQTSFYFVL